MTMPHWRLRCSGACSRLDQDSTCGGMLTVRGDSSDRYIAATIDAPPSTTRQVSGSPAMVTPKTPANVGSIVRITAVRVGVMYDCAQVWTKKPNEVAATPRKITANQLPVEWGSDRPPENKAPI